MTKLGVIVGSTRKDSFSQQWADNIVKLYPEGVEVNFIQIADLPLYNQDFDGQSIESYTNFRNKVQEQDMVLFITPEHNRSYSAALKNAIDVASRPWGQSVWGGKPALVVSHSISAVGGALANKDLIQLLNFLDMPVVGQPEVILSSNPPILENGVAAENTVAFLQTAVNAHMNLFNKMNGKQYL